MSLLLKTSRIMFPSGPRYIFVRSGSMFFIIKSALYGRRHFLCRFSVPTRSLRHRLFHAPFLYLTTSDECFITYTWTQSDILSTASTCHVKRYQKTLRN